MRVLPDGKPVVEYDPRAAKRPRQSLLLSRCRVKPERVSEPHPSIIIGPMFESSDMRIDMLCVFVLYAHLVSSPRTARPSSQVLAATKISSPAVISGLGGWPVLLPAYGVS